MYPVYLDNNATTRIAPEAVEAMMPFLSTHFGNPSSSHSLGRKAAMAVEEARQNVADLVGAEHPDEIIFTSCGTESNTSAIYGAIEAASGKRHVVISAVEHPAVKDPCAWLSEKGCRITAIPVNREGELDLDTFWKSVSQDTALVSLMWANNETGVIFPVEEISARLADIGVIFHTDAVQAAGKIQIDVKKTGISMLSISGHKFHAPKGVGALYVRRGTPFVPLLRGGGQERGRRSGTHNVASIVGMGVAAKLAKEGAKDHAERIRMLRDGMETRILGTVPGARINGRTAKRLVNTSSISFKGVNGPEVAAELDRIGICVSSGAACHSTGHEPSAVLAAMGLSTSEAKGTIRISLGRYTTEKEIDTLVGKLPQVIDSLLFPR